MSRFTKFQRWSLVEKADWRSKIIFLIYGVIQNVSLLWDLICLTAWAEQVQSKIKQFVKKHQSYYWETANNSTELMIFLNWKLRTFVNHSVYLILLLLFELWQKFGDVFVHHFSPGGLDPIRKTVAFVIDVSGSMYGTKLNQTKQALLTIMDQMRSNDHFNIITFSDEVSTHHKLLYTIDYGDWNHYRFFFIVVIEIIIGYRLWWFKSL